MSYQAEYIWIDGTEPTRKLRSKTKIIADGKKPPVWGFDGSSTNQATGEHSDCVLEPVFTCPNPLRGANDVLVMCEVLNPDMTPHVTNTRAAAVEVAKKYASFEPMFGIEQEYTFFQDGRPYGWPEDGFPAPQGPVLLRRRWREDARTRHRRGPHACVHARRIWHRRNERRGDDGPVGVPGRHARSRRDRRPALDRALAARAHRRGVRR